MKLPSWFLLIDFSLKSTLSDMSVATLACFWDYLLGKFFFHPLTLNQCFLLLLFLLLLLSSFFFYLVRWICCNECMVGSCFLTACYPMSFDWDIEAIYIHH
jgi:hypothetical protein